MTKSAPGTPMAARILRYVRHAPCPLTYDRLGRPIKGPCWLWTGFVRTNGYGQIKRTGTRENIGAHVASYEVFVGPIEPGYEIDHLCRVRHCANPGHLEAVTPGENHSRGDVALINARKTHCPKGHGYTPENTRLLKDGKGRACRQCAKEYQAWYQRWYNSPGFQHKRQRVDGA